MSGFHKEIELHCTW